MAFLALYFIVKQIKQFCKVIMKQLNQIYDCLLTDPCFSRTTYLGTQYSPWNQPDPQENKNKRLRTSIKRPQTVGSLGRFQQSKRTESEIGEKSPIKRNNYAFELTAPKIMLVQNVDKSRISTPIIKQKKTVGYCERYEKQPIKSNRFGILNCDYGDSSSLFLFKPKNNNPIQLRNKNIQLIRNIPRKKLFKTKCTDPKIA